MTTRLIIVSLLLIGVIAAPAVAGAGSTAASLNDQAIALERSGDYARAAERYEVASAVGDDAAVRSNLWRNRIRYALAIAAPIAQRFLVIMTGIWLLNRIIAGVRRMRNGFATWRLYRKVRVSDSAITVIDDRDRVEPSAALFPDAKKLTASVTIKNAGVRDHALCFAANLISPTGECVRTVRQFTDAGLAPLLATLEFVFDDLADVVKTGGSWKIELLLENNNKRLLRHFVWAVTRDMMIDDLIVEDFGLMVIDGEQQVESRMVPTTAQGIVPTLQIATVMGRSEKYRNFDLRLELMRAGDSEPVMAQHVPLHFENGVAHFCDLGHPVAGTAMADKGGAWKFRMLIDGREMTEIDFAVRTPEQLQGSVRAALDVAATSPAGDVSLVGNTVFRFEARTLVPMARLITPNPSPLAMYDVIFGAMADNEVIGHVQQRVALPELQTTLSGGEMDLAAFEGRGPISFFVMLNGRCVAVRDITLQLSRVRHADIEGRLTTDSRKEVIETDEADQLLNDAHIVA